MTAWTDAKTLARQAVHNTFGLSAVFYSTAAATPNISDDVVSVRIHDQSKAVGDLAGTNLSYAETMERPTQAVFLTSEMVGRSLSRGSRIVLFDTVGNSVGYFVDVPHPADGLTRSCDVTPMSATELSGLLLPDGTTVT